MPGCDEIGGSDGFVHEVIVHDDFASHKVAQGMDLEARLRQPRWLAAQQTFQVDDQALRRLVALAPALGHHHGDDAAQSRR